jgi:hypothetical protein
MFSSYYVVKKNLNYKQKADLLDVILKNAVLEPKPEYQTKTESRETEIKWPHINLHVPTNLFLTFIYEAMNKRTEENHPYIEVDSKELE